MNDDFLKNLREDPRPEFARSLHERIDAPLPPKRAFAFSAWKPALTWAGGLAALVLLFSFPSVRATAQGFLDLFRVKRFVAVPFDPARLARLKEEGVDFKHLLADNVEVLKEPGKPRQVDSVAEAAELAGIRLLEPTTLPRGTEAPEIHVKGEGKVRLTADTAKLRLLLDALQVEDVEIPAQLDGSVVTIDVPSSVIMNYKRGGDVVSFVQARSPEIALPEGVDLAQLGEIGLRIAGMPANEAASFARSVDWHGTLLVPVPANAASFREVNVRGTTGLLVSTGGTEQRPRPNRSVVLWSDGGMVYALSGGAASVELVEMANSIQ